MPPECPQRSQVGGLAQAGEETQNPLGLDDCPPAVPALLRAAPKGRGSWISQAHLHLTAPLEAKHSAEALGSGREQDQNLRPAAKAQRRNPAAKRKQTATARLPEVKSSTGFERPPVSLSVELSGWSQAEGLCGQAISSHDSSSNMNWVLRACRSSGTKSVLHRYLWKSNQAQLQAYSSSQS